MKAFTLPLNLSGFDLDGFREWLEGRGAELRDLTNEWEVVRYRAPSTSGSAPVVHVVYKNKRGGLNYQGWANKHYKDFCLGRDLGTKAKSAPARAKPPTRKKRGATISGDRKKRIVAELLERDGPVCWFCGEFMHDDQTLEHLLAKANGGGNRIENLVLAHKKCNASAADLSVADKVLMRDALLAKHVTTPPWESVRP